MNLENRKITIYDIAKEAGVSSATVSRTISGNGYVSEKSRQKILSLVEKYNFEPSLFARNLRAKFTKSIGFLVPNIENLYFAKAFYEFEKYAMEQGYLTFLCNGKNTRDLEAKIILSFMQKKVDGIVIMGGFSDMLDISPELRTALETVKKTIPVIIASEKATEFGCFGVHVDDYKGIELLFSHYQEQGIRTLGLVGGYESIIPSDQKRKAAYALADRYGIEIKQEFCSNCGFRFEDGVDFAKHILEEKQLPDAFCCLNDYVAAGVLNTMVGEGFNPLGKVAISGYDNVSISNRLRPYITTIDCNFHQFGIEVFSLMEQLMKGKEGIQPCVKLIEPHLVVRESTSFIKDEGK